MMSHLDDLLARYCPSGVKYLRLGDLEDSGLVKLGRGNVISKGDLASSPGEYPVYSSSASNNGEFGRYGNYMFDDERITWSVDGGGKFFHRPEHRYSVTNVCGWMKVLKPEDLSTKFLYFALINIWQTRTYNYTVKAHPSVIREDYLLPVPPIEVQREIVDILDKFTQLEAELEAELEARRKQYEHYRNELLSFKNIEGGVRWISMSDVFAYSTDRISGSSATSLPYVGVENLAKNRGGVESFGEVPATSAAIKFQAGDVLVGNIRPYLKKIWLADCDGGTNGDVLTIRVKPEFADQVEPRFAFQWLSSDEFFDYAVSTSKGAKMPRGDKSAILKFRFPLVPTKLQAEVVSALEKFQTLTSDLSVGLPAEIEARRKQYEYYRDKLLTFKELEVA